MLDTCELNYDSDDAVSFLHIINDALEKEMGYSKTMVNPALTNLSVTSPNFHSQHLQTTSLVHRSSCVQLKPEFSHPYKRPATMPALIVSDLEVHDGVKTPSPPPTSKPQYTPPSFKWTQLTSPTPVTPNSKWTAVASPKHTPTNFKWTQVASPKLKVQSFTSTFAVIPPALSTTGVFTRTDSSDKTPKTMPFQITAGNTNDIMASNTRLPVYVSYPRKSYDMEYVIKPHGATFDWLPGEEEQFISLETKDPFS
jgi:hypothetical protein